MVGWRWGIDDHLHDKNVARQTWVHLNEDRLLHIPQQTDFPDADVKYLADCKSWWCGHGVNPWNRQSNRRQSSLRRHQRWCTLPHASMESLPDQQPPQQDSATLQIHHLPFVEVIREIEKADRDVHTDVGAVLPRRKRLNRVWEQTQVPGRTGSEDPHYYFWMLSNAIVSPWKSDIS